MALIPILCRIFKKQIFFNSTTALLHQRFPVETPQLCVQEVTGFQPNILLEDFYENCTVNSIKTIHMYLNQKNLLFEYENLQCLKL